VVTYCVQRKAGATEILARLSLGERIENALVSYCPYLGKLIWPTHLAVFYPHPERWPTAAVWGAVLLLAGISMVALAARKRRPYLLCGWLWFLVMLGPVIGLVQVGAQAMADRYTYLPSIGIFLAAVLGAVDLLQSRSNLAARPGLRAAATVAAAAALVPCLLLTHRQVGFWKDDQSLFGHALKVTKNNCLAALQLGECAADRGALDLAVDYFNQSLSFDPTYAEARTQLGLALFKKGATTDGLKQLEQAVHEAPSLSVTHGNFGNALYQSGRFSESIREYEAVLRIDPESFEAHLNLGLALARTGQVEEGLRHLYQAVKLEPASGECHRDLAFVLALQGRREEALGHLQEALRLRPDDAEAQRQLRALTGQGAGR
jgi:tetratricopeptide (TPR) repeat protein